MSAAKLHNKIRKKACFKSNYIFKLLMSSQIQKSFLKSTPISNLQLITLQLVYLY